MMTLAAILALIDKLITLITTGALLGIGFWAGRKITDFLDAQLVMRDKKLMSALQEIA